MRRFIILSTTLWMHIFCVGCIADGSTSQGDDETITFTADEVSIIKNPGMGWMLYDDANGEIADAEEYWEAQNQIAVKYASTFYIRWRWSDMEPTEGCYAWESDDNYKRLIQGALDRGLKLAFRIYVDGQDNLREATPQFVFDAGCSYYMTDKLYGDENRSPYADDPIFQQKYSNFIQAFAKEYDNASIVDYVDGFNLGWWGEGHHIICQNEFNLNSVAVWIYDLYGEAFKSVMLVTTLPGDLSYSQFEKCAYTDNGYNTRRDGFASKWFSDAEKEYMLSIYEDQMIVAEACYWGSEAVPTDPIYTWDSWSDYYTQVVTEALYYHANYLDARTVWTSKRYMDDAEDQLIRFAQKGGYRLYPSEVTISPAQDGYITIDHTWENIGAGLLPNNDKRWDYKYKVSFAFIDNSDNITHQWVTESAQLYDIRKNSPKSYSDKLKLPSLNGEYRLCVAITDSTQDDLAAINIALKGVESVANGWYIIKNYYFD